MGNHNGSQEERTTPTASEKSRIEPITAELRNQKMRSGDWHVPEEGVCLPWRPAILGEDMGVQVGIHELDQEGKRKSNLVPVSFDSLVATEKSAKGRKSGGSRRISGRDESC